VGRNALNTGIFGKQATPQNGVGKKLAIGRFWLFGAAKTINATLPLNGLQMAFKNPSMIYQKPLVFRRFRYLIAYRAAVSRPG
jgi:hypothetical protein